ncbi:MAG: HIT family protein [Microgenomates group bacterium]
MKDCIFCKIVSGEILCWKIYEDKDFLAFLDINPFVDGHTLVIPKKHYQWVWQVPELGRYFEVVKKIAVHYQKVFQDEFVASLIWGTEVPHAHIHLLPSAYNLKLFALGERKQLPPEKAKELVEKLRLV